MQPSPTVSGARPNEQHSVAYRRRPADVLAAVEIVLHSLGLTRLYLCACPIVGVISVSPDVTAWTDGRTIRWRHAGAETRWSAADPEGAARQLAELANTASA
jgi:hypothetical protein